MALPNGIFADLVKVEWDWGCPRPTYAFEHSVDGDWHGFDGNDLFFDLVFWFLFFPLTTLALMMALRKIGAEIRLSYSANIVGILTLILYAFLLRPDIFINAATGGYFTCFESRREQFEQAMQFGDVEAAKTLLKNHPDLVFSKDAGGWTSLHEATYYGQDEIVKLLLADKADVNAKDTTGETPLFDAAMNENKVATELLLNSGAEVNIRDNIGDTPLFRATESAGSGAIKLLLANKANVDSTNFEGWTPLLEAAWRGNAYTVQLLIASNAQANITDVLGETPLHLAVSGGHKKVVELLLANKANVNAKDRNGTTPLQIALDYTNAPIVELLRQYEATNN